MRHETYVHEQRMRVQARKRELQQRLREYKTQLRCQSCGESHPATLDFHHRDGATKERNISNMPREGASWERILEEIAKCDVLCANCHRKFHYNASLG